jgi:hypothetical protein
MASFKTRQAWESSGDPLATEERAFRRQHGQLLRCYAGQFVALYQGRVIGHGTDDEELARQMFARLGDAPFYIAKVETEPGVYELPSPEVVR